MAKGRMLNKSISASVKFDRLPDDTCRLMATWIISHLDKNGVFYGDPVMVRSLVFPRRPDITLDQVACYLQAIDQVGLITLFEAEGQTWQYWPGFTDNQINLRADRETSDFPPPPADPGPVADEPEPTGTPPEPSNYDNKNNGSGLTEESRKDAGKMPEQSPPNLKESNLNQYKLNKENGAGKKTPAETPEKPPPEKPSKPKPEPTTVPAAVELYRAICHRYPAKETYPLIAEVGEASADLERWERVIRAYIGCGWNPKNVVGMLDFFRKGETPTTNKNGAHYGQSGRTREDQKQGIGETDLQRGIRAAIKAKSRAGGAGP